MVNEFLKYGCGKIRDKVLEIRNAIMEKERSPSYFGKGKP